MTTPTMTIIATHFDPCGVHAHVLTDKHDVTFFCYAARGTVVLRFEKATHRSSGHAIGRGLGPVGAAAREALEVLIGSLASVGGAL